MDPNYIKPNIKVVSPTLNPNPNPDPTGRKVLPHLVQITHFLFSSDKACICHCYQNSPAIPRWRVGIRVPNQPLHRSLC